MPAIDEKSLDFSDSEKEEKKLKKCGSEEVFEKASVAFIACQLTLIDYDLYKNLKFNVLLVEFLNDETNGLSAIRDNFNLVNEYIPSISHI